ncbi:mitochondrial nicotinamide adenine dinucleotide transporter SLC25A51 [Caerostris darwini]|uniref:Mitochondrial nicotinamide adenine dinucleotide transporter SLC25A51 n=1 Tax=Caerostris darwini TaxID=1538125 RepID=A0AAV4QNI4_9ARAC|nr:mitochondrial nicotinamide adenine dinucleotide transporter SLC25A51 [Caerostris darwini]
MLNNIIQEFIDKVMCCINKMAIAPIDNKEYPISNKEPVMPLSDSRLTEYACGWGSGFINIMITFPINKVMFRQMLHGVDSQHAFNQIKREGMRFLYRGVLPPLLQKATSTSIMFGSYKEFSEIVQGKFPSMQKFSVLCTAAILAGSAEAVLTPFERIQTLLQDRHYNTKFKNTYHAFSELRQQHGFKEFYRGMTPILLRNSVGNILFFGLKDFVKDFLPIKSTDSVLQEFVKDFISGAFVGAFTSTVFYPVNVVKTKMQVNCGTPFVSLSEAFKQTYIERDRSIRKLYYGVHVNYTRSFLSWGIINASNQLLKKIFFNETSNS